MDRPDTDLRRQLEAAVEPLARSLDGRAFELEASVDAPVQPGSYVELETPNAPVLGQVVESRLELREGHPVLWSLADASPDEPRLVIDHPYFETVEGQVWDDGEVGVTYVETDQVFQTTVTHEWSHGRAEIVTALLDAGMEVTRLEEHDSVPWEALPGRMTRLDGGEWRLSDRPERLPHSYTLQARRAG